jgi:hypothetical protein
VFDRSRKTLFGEADGGDAGKNALPKFEPQAGGFGRRQTPVGDLVGQPLSNMRKAGKPGAGAHNENHEAARDNQHEIRHDRAELHDLPEDDFPLGVDAITGGLAAFGSRKAAGPSHVATQLEQWLTKELRHADSRRETTLTAIGALAGFAAQHGIWEAVVKPGKMALQQAFVIVETRSGETYFFGDFLNNILATQKPEYLSVWKIVGAAAKAMGATELPDLVPMFKYSAETVGSPQFGVPNLPDDCTPSMLPRDALTRFWPGTLKMLRVGSDPLTCAVDVATAAEQIMLSMKGEIDPALAARIIMEAAIPMSKVDPLTVPKE